LETNAKFKITVKASSPTPSQPELDYIKEKVKSIENILKPVTTTTTHSPLIVHVQAAPIQIQIPAPDQARNFFKPMTPHERKLPQFQLQPQQPPKGQQPPPQFHPSETVQQNFYRMFEQNLHQNNPPFNNNGFNRETDYFMPQQQQRQQQQHQQYNQFNPIHDFFNLHDLMNMDYPNMPPPPSQNEFLNFMRPQPSQWGGIEMRFRRDSLRQQEPNEDLEEEKVQEIPDKYDSSKFYKVRLSIGPISVQKPHLTGQDEDITCELDLLNSHSPQIIDYSSTVHKKIQFVSEPRIKTSTSSPTTTTSTTASMIIFESTEMLQSDEMPARKPMKKSNLFLIDEPVSHHELRKSEALESIKTKGLLHAERLLSSSSRAQMFSWSLVVVAIVIPFLF